MNLSRSLLASVAALFVLGAPLAIAAEDEGAVTCTGVTRNAEGALTKGAESDSAVVSSASECRAAGGSVEETDLIEEDRAPSDIPTEDLGDDDTTY